MTLKDRVRKLEGDQPERCNNCLPWGDTLRISYLLPDGTETDPSGPPERCPTCGYEPVLVLISFTEEAGRL